MSAGIMVSHSANYDYILATARRLADTLNPRVLDFGCGLGHIIRLGLSQGLDIYGVDTFAGWREQVGEEVAGRIRQIDSGLPFEDGHFDVIVSNMVFEHIAEPARVLPEIRRVLKPGGAFLAIFPLRETWYEGHVGLYFPHRLQAWPALQRKYLALAHRLGFGLERDEKTSMQWAADRSAALQQSCFYHRERDVRRWWCNAFGEAPVSLAADYVGFRLRASRLARAVPQLLRDPLFRAICQARAGAVLLVRNRKS